MLKEIIELKRKQMIHTARIFGLTAAETVKCSQELDRFLDLHHEYKKNSRFYKDRKLIS